MNTALTAAAGVAVGFFVAMLVAYIRSPRRYAVNLGPIELPDSRIAMSSVMEELVTRQAALEQNLRAVASSTERAIVALSDRLTGTPPPHNPDLVRELAHNLGTPLSQIDLLLERVKRADGEVEHMERAHEAVALCQTILEAYREVESVSSSLRTQEARSVREMLVSAWTLYQRAHHRNDLLLQLDAPDSVRGYTSYYITAVLCPILENAVERADAASVVEVEYKEVDRKATFEVTNACTDMPIESHSSDTLLTIESQPRHAGLGIPSARRMLSRTGGSLDLYTSGARVTARVTLPLGKPQDETGGRGS